MAGNIKGITIEFNGDTTKLDKALRDVRNSSKNIDSELKKVNQSLKFNPNNTQLLAQKQELLSQKIKQTETNLKGLKDMQQQVANDPNLGKNSKEYRELEREIIKAENNLKRFNAEQKKIKASLSPLGQFSAKMKNVSNSLNEAGQRMRGLSIASAAVVAALTGITYKAGVAADDLNTLSATYSIGTKELQKYGLAAKQVDVSVADIAKSHVRLEKNMLSAANGSKNQAAAFEKLGVEYKNADGSLREGDAVWQDIIKSLGKMTNETERDALAMQLMGKSAAMLNPLIEDGGETYERIGKLLKKYDLDFIDQKTLDRANEFNDTVDDMKTIVTLSVQTIGSQIAGTLLPMMGKVLNAVGNIAQWITNLDPKILAIVGGIAGVVAALSPLLIGLGKIAFAISNISNLMATLSVSMTALPFGVVLAGLAGVTTLVLGVTEATKSYTQAEENLMKTYEQNAEARKKSVSDSVAQIAVANQYMSQIEKLNEKEKLSNSEKEKMRQLVDAVNTALGTEVVKVDETTGKLKESTDAIYKRIDALKEQAIAEAYQSNFKAAIQDQIELEKQLHDIKVKIDALEEKEANRTINAKEKKELHELNDAYDSLYGKMGKAGVEAEYWQKKMSGATETVKNKSKSTTNSVSSDADKVTKSTKKAGDSVAKNLGDGYQKAVELSKERMGEIEKNTATAKKNIEKYGKNTGKGYADGLLNGISKDKLDKTKTKITTPFEKAVNIIKKAIDKIKKIVNGAKLQLPHFKLPHFVISGGKLPWGIGGKGKAPSIDVKWYKNGGIFNSPSVIGVGEKNKEAVVPLLGREMKPFAEAIAKNINGNGGNTYNITVSLNANDVRDVNTVDEFLERVFGVARHAKGFV